jgi:hypothetical protein
MKDEMDLLKMSAPDRICWLRANRITLMIVGLIWIGMILHQLFSGTVPWFLIAMVPVFALTRLGMYAYYKRGNAAPELNYPGK